MANKDKVKKIPIVIINPEALEVAQERCIKNLYKAFIEYRKENGDKYLDTEYTNANEK